MRYFLILAALWYTIDAQATSNCAREISATSCEYYRCRERTMQCGLDGYLENFGHKYCQIFKNDLSIDVSKKGQQWLKNNSACLQQQLEQVKSSTSCRKLKQKAISSHSKCYTQTGFCSLPAQDIALIIETIGHELFFPKVFKSALQTIKICGWGIKKTLANIFSYTHITKESSWHRIFYDPDLWANFPKVHAENSWISIDSFCYKDGLLISHGHRVPISIVNNKLEHYINVYEQNVDDVGEYLFTKSYFIPKCN
ncbi:MAG: hypothetical protein ISR65_20250 [Bacteriovoracaceae bacterium]|nr:hypothetical protein [Bacteriovoracaceae bacterium]